MAVDDAIRSWPLDGPDDEGALHWSSGDASIRECLLTLLLTRPGERLMRPDLGAGITRFVHQPNNATIRGLIAGAVQRALAQGEPRIAIEAVAAEADPARSTAVNVAVSYRRLADGARGDLAIDLDLAP